MNRNRAFLMCSAIAYDIRCAAQKVSHSGVEYKFVDESWEDFRDRILEAIEQDVCDWVDEFRKLESKHLEAKSRQLKKPALMFQPNKRRAPGAKR